jgi:hypothetical protein
MPSATNLIYELFKRALLWVHAFQGSIKVYAFGFDHAEDRLSRKTIRGSRGHGSVADLDRLTDRTWYNNLVQNSHIARKSLMSLEP